MRDSVGTKKLINFKKPIVFWQCTNCGLTGTCKLSNWKSSKARTCCGEGRYRNRDRLLIVWTDIRNRCNDPRHPAYPRYKDFDITGWNSFAEFKDWALNNGYEYGLQIDRIDNSRGYFPENCRFVTPKQNSRNRKNNRLLEAFGEKKTITEWEEDPRCSIKAQSIVARLDRYGWTDIEKAITTPSRFERK